VVDSAGKKNDRNDSQGIYYNAKETPHVIARMVKNLQDGCGASAPINYDAQNPIRSCAIAAALIYILCTATHSQFCARCEFNEETKLWENKKLGCLESKLPVYKKKISRKKRRYIMPSDVKTIARL